MATYSEVIYCKNCKYCKSYYHGEYSKKGMFSYTCTKELKEVQPFNFCSWADYKERKEKTMARMIYADDLYEAMNQVGAFEVLKNKRKEQFTTAWEVPIVDAEPVVRCKDCIVQKICRFAQFLGNDGYCSQGKRCEEVEE